MSEVVQEEVPLQIVTSPKKEKLKKVRCIRPFTTLEMQLNGDVTFCCKEWTKLSVIGNVKATSVVNIWNSEAAQFIRQKMLDEEWDAVCNKDVCPVLKSEDYKELDMEAFQESAYPITEKHLDEIRNRKTVMYPPPTYMLLANNDACNIKCPTCYPYRDIYKGKEDGSYLPEIKKAHQEILGREDMELSEKVVDELIAKDFIDLKVLRLSGAGDPFYRKDTRRLLLHPEKPPGMKVELLTNALLLDENMWEKIKHNNVSLIDVSVDAGSQETYEKVRNFGKWNTLVKNLRFIGELRKKEVIPLFLMNFTVQRSNYREMIPFTMLAKELGADSVYFARVRGQIWDRENFFDGDDYDADVLEELEEIKLGVTNLTTPDFIIRFHNL